MRLLMKIEMIAFDADDTLWHGEVHYHDAQAELIEILSPWDDPETIDGMLAEIEMKNLPLYGYGVKAFVLSMIEAAIKIASDEIPAKIIEKILSIGRNMLETELELLPHVPDTLEILSKDFPLMVITKGDLLDQTAKVSRSGLERFFPLVEVVNDKTPESYRLVLDKFQINPKNLVMVGNSIRSDVLPVLALGGKAVYIPANTTWEHEMVPDFNPAQEGFYEIEHMGLLPKLISEILGK
jgi:putative hydrolase of the HAD superfamily